MWLRLRRADIPVQFITQTVVFGGCQNNIYDLFWGEKRRGRKEQHFEYRIKVKKRGSSTFQPAASRQQADEGSGLRRGLWTVINEAEGLEAMLGGLTEDG